jgi:hypothetical protein
MRTESRPFAASSAAPRSCPVRRRKQSRPVRGRERFEEWSPLGIQFNEGQEGREGQEGLPNSFLPFPPFLPLPACVLARAYALFKKFPFHRIPRSLERLAEMLSREF